MPSEIKIEIRAKFHSSQGKLIRALPWKKANSLLLQFIQLLQIQASQVSSVVKKTDGTSAAESAIATAFRLNAVGTDITWGLQVGTDATPVTMADYQLVARVSTNIVFGIVSFAAENPDASTWRLAIARTFLNNTGASLGIREVGLYSVSSTGGKFICLDRSLYSVDVPNGVTVTMTYRITVSL